MELPQPKLKRKRGAGVRWLQYMQAGTEEEEEEGSSFKCSGVLVGGSVLVQNSADIAALLSRGFFGKAVFSRSIPTHVQTQGTYVSHKNEHYSLGSGFEPPRKRARVSEEEKEGADSEESEEEAQRRRRRRRLLLHTQWREEKERGRIITVEQSSGVEGKRDPDSSATRDEEESSRIPGHFSGPPSEHPIIASADGDVSGRAEQTEAVAEKRREDEQAAEDGDAVYDPEHPEMDPYPVVEPLCLSSEEAFYLMAEAGMLTVLSPTAANSFTAGELWTQLCAYCHRFPFTYSVYRHYRKKGWVPKSGFKFGVDFILYKDGPEFYHSSYAVLVCKEVENTEVDQVLHAATTGEGVCSASTDEGHGDLALDQSTAFSSQLQARERRASEAEMVSEGSTSAPSSPHAATLVLAQPIGQKTAVEAATTSSSPAKTSATAETVFQKIATPATETGDVSMLGLTWSDVIAHCRVSESSGKELVVCYVITPADWDETWLQSPECVECMSVREVLVTRWMPERDR